METMTRYEKALAILREGTVIPATTLALDENRQFDEARQRLLTRYYLEAGSGGVATAVHSTQFEIRLYEEETGRTVVRVCGVCGPVEQALREAKTARRLGFDAVLLSPGGLNALSEEEMLARTKAVAEVMPVIGFYLQTAVGGRVFSYDYWARLAEIEDVVAIKCASFNRYTTLDVVRAVTLSSRADQIALYTGNDDNIVIDLLTKYRFEKDGRTVENGFRGGLLGHWSIWTAKVVEMFRMLRDAEPTAELLTLAAQVTDCNSAFFDTAHNFRGCIAGMHEVLRRQGLIESICCLDPEETLSPGQAEEIDRVYAAYPHLNDDAFVREYLKRRAAR